jgi:hypothetical protein
MTLAFPYNNVIVPIIIILLLVIGLFLFMIWLLIFKATWLINKLHLDKGFTEDRLELNIKYSTVLVIAIIVIGGIMVVDTLPTLCKQTFTYFQQKRMFMEDTSSGWIIFLVIKTITGYLLMTNSQFIVKFIDKNIPKQNDNIE